MRQLSAAASVTGITSPCGIELSSAAYHLGEVRLAGLGERCGERWPTEPGHRPGLDLADPLAGYAVDPADLVQGLRLAVGQAEPHRDDARLALGQRVEHRVELLLEQGEGDRLAGLDLRQPLR